MERNHVAKNTQYKAYDFIKSDCYRYTCKSDLFSVFKLYMQNSVFRWQVAFRMCKASGIKKVIGLFMWRMNRQRKKIQIPRSTQIGYGFYIAHEGYIVISSTATIGNNCNISQFCTIGTNAGRAANIGNNVYIGPNSCIVENVTIEDNVTIGAGSVVTKDVPKNATVAGNYAKVLNFDNPGRFILNRWEM